MFESVPEDWRSWLVFLVASEFLYASAFKPQGAGQAKIFVKKIVVHNSVLNVTMA
jgi:hypothetical protein